MRFELLFDNDLINIRVNKNADNCKNIFVPDLETIIILLRVNKRLDTLREIYNLIENHNIYELDYNRKEFLRNRINNLIIPSINILNSYLMFVLNNEHCSDDVSMKYKYLNRNEKIISFIIGHFVIPLKRKIIMNDIRHNKLFSRLSFLKLNDKKLDTFKKRKMVFSNLSNYKYYEVDIKAYFIQFLNHIFDEFNIEHQKLNDYSDLSSLFKKYYNRNLMKKKVPQKIFSILNGNEYIDNKLGKKLEKLKNELDKRHSEYNIFNVKFDEIESNYKKFLYLKNLYFYKVVYDYVINKDDYFNPLDLGLFGDSFGFISKYNINSVDIKIPVKLKK